MQPHDPTLAGAEKPGNRGRSRPESNLVEATVVTADGIKYVKGRFLWAPPRIEDFCRAAAVRYLRSFWSDDEVIPERDINNEKAQLILSWSLRREDDKTRQVYPWPDNCFNPTTGEWNMQALRSAAIRDQCPNVNELWGWYRAFAESEFPPNWTEKQWRELVSEGKELSVEMFLSKHGFLPTLRALPGLAVSFALSNSTTGSGGRP